MRRNGALISAAVLAVALAVKTYTFKKGVVEMGMYAGAACVAACTAIDARAGAVAGFIATAIAVLATIGLQAEYLAMAKRGYGPAGFKAFAMSKGHSKELAEAYWGIIEHGVANGAAFGSAANYSVTFHEKSGMYLLEELHSDKLVKRFDELMGYLNPTVQNGWGGAQANVEELSSAITADVDKVESDTSICYDIHDTSTGSRATFNVEHKVADSAPDNKQCINAYFGRS